MRYEEKELLQGMRNCYRVCGEDFEGTVGMVSAARGREKEEVKVTLLKIAKKYADSEEYLKLRKQIPAEFPF